MKLREALQALVQLEADGHHASENAIEYWERARAALAEPVADEPCNACNDTGVTDIPGVTCPLCKVAAAAPAERGEYPPDAVIAQCMLAVDDPLLWGRLGENSGDMVRQFARAVIDADRAQRVPLTDEQITRIAHTPEPVSVSAVHTFARAIEHAHGIGAKP